MIPRMLTAFTPLTLFETCGIHTPVRSPSQALANGGAFFDETLLTASPPRDRDEPNYWSVVFDVVTPAAWERLVEAATCQARAGDPRAREWIANVLGADSAIEELGRADAVAGYLTISSLNRALERERAAAGDRPGYED